MKKILVIGAGFSGSTIAHKLALNGYQVVVSDARSHIAGNCYSEKDEKTGITVHKYGAHIFHTDNHEVWEFLNNFGEFMPYINRVKSTVKGKVYSLPINLHTINQFFNTAKSPQEARDFVLSLADASIATPENFEQQALKFLGKDLYEAFFRGYTKKQWGISPTDLPASILKRLPVRFSYDDNYFNHKYQGIPKHGYTSLIERMLDHDLIQVVLNRKITRNDINEFDHTFYSGPIDEWLSYSEGSLGYRTLDFEVIRKNGDYQGCAVMNYGDEEVPYTRIVEHKHFAPWEEHEKTIVYKEYSRSCGQNDVPYYPIRLVNEQAQLKKYIELAKQEERISFIGRLGTYRYLDMDVTIAEALDAASQFIRAVQENKKIPTFFVDPLK